MIFWKELKNGKTYGFLGNVEMFVLVYDSRAEVYNLSCYLPGINKKLKSDKASAIKEADNIIKSYIKLLQENI